MSVEAIMAAIENCPDYLDFAAAWAIQRDRGTDLSHHPKCSSVPGHDPLSGPGFLCDCDAVKNEWLRLKASMRANDTGDKADEEKK